MDLGLFTGSAYSGTGGPINIQNFFEKIKYFEKYF
jgi:hypothetical protein